MEAPRTTSLFTSSQTSRGRILVVDDEPDLCELFQMILELEGYAVEVANSGSGALVAVAANPPDVIWLDLVMEGVDGFDVLRALKASPATARIPVLVVSARVEQTALDRALACGATATATKPFPVQAVLEIISRLVSASATDMRAAAT